MKTSRLALLLCVVGLCLGVSIWWYARPDPKLVDNLGLSEHGPDSRTAPAATFGTIEEPAPASAPAGPDDADRNPPSLLSALSKTSRFDRRQELERFGYDIGSKGIARATEMLSEITALPDRSSFLRGVFSKLAEGSSAAAFNALQSLKHGPDRAAALEALIANWETEVSEAIQKDFLSFPVGNPNVRQLARLLGNPALAAEAAMTLLAGEDRAQLLQMAAVATVEQDPQRALQYAQNLEGAERIGLFEAVGRAWGRRASESALAWANAQADPGLRSRLQSQVLIGWGFHQPEKAAARVAEISDPETRRKALEFITFEWGMTDTQAALNWARAQPDPATREQSLASIQSSAPVGIGVSLASSPEGLPMIQGLIPNSPASASGTLQPGYQIAAVADGRGGFTELHGMNIGDVAKLLRGKPGSTVVMQVVPEGASINQRRLVSITRQQLIFKAQQGTP